MRISDWSSDVCSSDLTARRSPRPSGWRHTRDGTRSAEWFMAGRSTATRLRRQDAIRSQSIAAPPEIHPRSGVIPDEREDPGTGRCPQPAFERPLTLQLLVVLEPDPVDQLELSLQEIDVVLVILEDHHEKITAI